MSRTAIVLAAGLGTRMKSKKPKVLHQVMDAPMLEWVLDATLSVVDHAVVVVGHGKAEVESFLRDTYGDKVSTAHQVEQKGTGDAVKSALPKLPAAASTVLVLGADTPLLTGETLKKLLDEHQGRGKNASVTILTTHLANPTGYGRMLRDNDGFCFGIQEEKDCSAEQKKVSEINSGMYAFEVPFLKESVAKLGTNNAQGEYYLTDLVKMAYQASPEQVRTVNAAADELEGVNDRVQLVAAEEVLQKRINVRWGKAGVTLRQPGTIFIGKHVTLGEECELDAHVTLKGRTSVGKDVRIGTGSVLNNTEVGDGVVIKPYTVADQSVVQHAAILGPFSHLRPESDIGEEAHVGNFVEVKKTKLGKGSKANHLAYLGDGVIGNKVNIGAGTIFCNYDGFNKHVTTIEDGAFIGSDSQLVAPVTIGQGAYVGTGTTVTRDVPANALAISRVKQDNKEGYADRLRARMKK